MVERFMVFMTGEEGKEKPCVVLSPNEMNEELTYVIIAPITTRKRKLPFRIPLILKEKNCQLMLDKIQTVPKSDLKKHIGVLPAKSHSKVCAVLQKIFEK